MRLFPLLLLPLAAVGIASDVRSWERVLGTLSGHLIASLVSQVTINLYSGYLDGFCQ